MRNVALVLNLAAVVACDGTRMCGGTQIMSTYKPDTASVRVGASITTVAGDNYESCDPPRREYIWAVSDSTIVHVSQVDSITVRITGLHVGTAVVQPRYVAGGYPLQRLTVTVIP